MYGIGVNGERARPGGDEDRAEAQAPAVCPARAQETCEGEHRLAQAPRGDGRAGADARLAPSVLRGSLRWCPFVRAPASSLFPCDAALYIHHHICSIGLSMLFDASTVLPGAHPGADPRE